ncbi:hypothetical protein BZG35_04210 [Brevundimonas sp. LM2]|uniref:DUF4908 domain-containing protein n=1 Tax=Brevundimonas sp. LM2 TaxID=1938605 RepID=UPI000983C908|nr:DUF4908 domain-containing protein [Brevundimonas sp. LM2]AQR60946.1 hypothetical protein BZG35_04210 [Brevundimonas sp. LM2]
MPVAHMAAFAMLMAITLAPDFAVAQVRSNAQAEQRRAIAVPTRRGLPPSGRYVSDGGEAFILDGTGLLPLFRFERRPETWVLRATPAPRGDIIYRNDAGSQILRVTPAGGITLYTTAAPNGAPVSRTGPAAALTLPPLGPIRLFTLMNQRGSLVSQALGRLVVINLSGERSEALMVDTLIVSTEAVIRMARSPTFRASIATLRSITLVEGDRSTVSFLRGDLRIVVDPDEGQAGRPSSARIIRAVAGN